MGFKLYASMGTADYYTEHGVEVSKTILVSLILFLIRFFTFTNTTKLKYTRNPNDRSVIAN